ncbi:MULTISPECIES: HPr-rel-A system PqqD family peptide chaperone [unclassified Rubrivivax]|uniref:HPr-rel-A system PqqD family peptide chaperone n=1 Tax=unclassified Rubrivivax TaxID=2649762 RepID=UPI001E605FD0|nr:MULTISPECIES: HPr-rel-A system PqqD family peptide chaperone [unclassified Rubrivivax]MCC9596304.1 HPr-rel-A system PqqD family peptide chaperone [Rubrivivax sp. JA1055]MCC9647355.1 HPr-rel-A system PqqD family peptide chaperone [Rubrivivax sp. JA1029]
MTAATWSLTREAAIHVRSWDDSACAIAFDERSGDTFTLGALALELMAMLHEHGAQSEPALAAALAAELGTELPADMAGAIGTELEQLRTRGLVARLDS